MEMEANGAFPGERQINLKKSFTRAIRPLLTACSMEEFRKAFPNLSASEQQRLHGLFIQVIKSVHQDIEEEVQSMFLETQVGTVLDTVEELVEESNLDPLDSKSNVAETAINLSEAKRNELRHLTALLKKAEEQKQKINERLDLLKKDQQDFSGAVNLVGELTAANLRFDSDQVDA